MSSTVQRWLRCFPVDACRMCCTDAQPGLFRRPAQEKAMPRPTPSQYNTAQNVIHWLIFLLFVVALASIEYRDSVPKATGQALRDSLRAIHVAAGLLVLLLAVVRLEEFLRRGAPPVLAHARWQVTAAHLLHATLYVVMFALPITGIVFAQAGGRSVAFFGWELPLMVSQNAALRHNAHELHEFLGSAVYVLVGLHVAASLWHHFVLGDDTLRRMRPFRATR
jgi:cytochrome b561